MKKKTQITIVIFASIAILVGLICFILTESPVLQPAAEILSDISSREPFSQVSSRESIDSDWTEPVDHETIGKININTAGREELMTLAGIGAVTADAIIAYRETHGLFQDISQIKEVNGIGEKKFAAIADAITVG